MGIISIGNFAKSITVEAASDLEYFMEPTKDAVMPGETFDVTIKIKNASQTPIKTAGLYLSYDKNILDIVDADDAQTGKQLKASGTLSLVSENTADNGEVRFTAGATQSINSSEITLATMKMKAKDTAPSGITQLAFIKGGDTSILGEDGTTELLSIAHPLDIAISKMQIQVTPATKNLKANEILDVTFSISNPDSIAIVTSEMKANFDTKVFDFVPSNSGKPTEMDLTDSDYALHVDKYVQDGLVHYSGGKEGTNPLTKTNITVGSIKLKVKENAPVGKTSIIFDTKDTITYAKDNVTTNWIASMVDGEYTIDGNTTTPRYSLTLTASAAKVDLGRTVDITATVMNLDTNAVAKDMEVSFSKTSGDFFTFPDSFFTDSKGQVTIGFKPTELATVSAQLREYPDVKDDVQIDVNKSIGRVHITKSSLSATQNNLIPVTVEDANGDPVPDKTDVTLKITNSDGVTKTYFGTTVSGVAVIDTPADDYDYGKTYTLIAYSGGLESNTVVIPIDPLKNTTTNTSGNLRPSPTQNSSTGPKENMLVILLVVSGIIAWRFEKIKHKEFM